MLGQIKVFTRQRKEVQDKRRKTAELVFEQLDDAYRVCCVVEGHLKTAERQDNGKGQDTNRVKQDD